MGDAAEDDRRVGTPFRGDGSQMPSFGGWAAVDLPAEAVARAGFEWFETGYPGDTRTNEILANAGVRPFAYISLGELSDERAVRVGVQRRAPADERRMGKRISST